MDRITSILRGLRNHPITTIAYSFIGVFGVLLVAAVANEAFWFSDDGAAYLLLAKAFSPYYQTSSVIIEGALRENYPPLFPAILALFGASHSFFFAHLIVVLFFIAALALVFQLAEVMHKDKVFSLLSLFFFALIPGVFLGLLGILSEPLYILLSVGALLLMQRHWVGQQPELKQSILLAILLAALLLTRSIGVSLVAALFMFKLLEERNLRFLLNKIYAIPLVVPCLFALLWHYVRPVLGESLYEGIVVDASKSVLRNPIDAITPQLLSLNEAWHSSLHIYWATIWSPVYLLSAVMGLVVLGVLFYRLRQNKIDAWYVLIYIAIILVWPHPGQQVRFLFPLLPLSAIYFFIAIQVLRNRLHTNKLARYSPMFASLLIVAIILPPQAFILTRISDAKQTDKLRSMLITYYHPSKEIARFNAKLHYLLRKDMQRLQSTTESDATIMWFIPKYVYLLAERRGVELPPNKARKVFLQQVLQSNADYAYLSRFNPWEEGFNNQLHYLLELSPFSTRVWNQSFYDNITNKELTFSVLFKIDRQRLKDLLQELDS